MNYSQNTSSSHGFDIAELSGHVPTSDHYAVLREHGRFFFAQTKPRGRKSTTWRMDPLEATAVSKERAEEIASLYPGRVVAVEAKAVLAAYKGSASNG
jgi:hypothetical protein